MSSASTVQARMLAWIYVRAAVTSTLRAWSLRGSARESARPPLAPPARLLLALLRQINQHELAAAGSIAGDGVRPVGLHRPGAVRRRQLGFDGLGELLPEDGILHRDHHLHPALEVALHAVGGADEPLVLAAIAEVVDPSVFEKATDDADHPNGVGESRDAGPQPAGIAHDQIHLHAGL